MYENLPPVEISRKIKIVYGESTISVQHMRKWYRKFKSGCENIIDEIRSGTPISITDKTLENKADTIIQCNWKAKLFDIAYQVNAAYGTVQNIITKILKYQKMYAYWIPHMGSSIEISTIKWYTLFSSTE